MDELLSELNDILTTMTPMFYSMFQGTWVMQLIVFVPMFIKVIKKLRSIFASTKNVISKKTEKEFEMIVSEKISSHDEEGVYSENNRLYEYLMEKIPRNDMGLCSAVISDRFKLVVNAKKVSSGTTLKYKGQEITVTLVVEPKKVDKIVLRTTVSMSFLCDYLAYLKKEHTPKKEIVSKRGGANWTTTPITFSKTPENLFLNDGVTERLISEITEFNSPESKKMYNRWGIPHKRGYIFHGVPGCGKTSTIYCLANHFQMDVYFIDPNENVRFRNINPGSIVVVEDIDSHSCSHKRELVEDTKDEKKVVGGGKAFKTLLEVLDGQDYLHDCVVIFTTNHIDHIDPAIIRPGRIDKKIEFSHLTTDTFFRLVKFYYGDEFSETDFDLSDGTTSISSAQIINTHIIPNITDYKAFVAEFNKVSQ